MSQPPHYTPPPQVIVNTHQQPTNGLGLAGFITSLVGLVSCGFLSPIGLLLSLFGLMKQPRGFAIAGTVLGLLGTAFLAFVGFALVMGILGLGKAVEAIGNEFKSMEAGHKAALVINEERARTNSLPSDAAGTAMIKAHTDAWGRPLVYKRTGETFTITSLGEDGQADTADDRKWSEAELKRDPSTQPSGLDDDEELDELETTDEAAEPAAK